MSFPNYVAASTGAEPATRLRTLGHERLSAGEDPNTIAKYLSQQGLSALAMGQMFLETAQRQRRRAIATISLGLALSLLTVFLVWGAMEAGLTLSGSGLLVGLLVTAKGILRLKNASEIGRVGKSLG